MVALLFIYPVLLPLFHPLLAALWVSSISSTSLYARTLTGRWPHVLYFLADPFLSLSLQSMEPSDLSLSYWYGVSVYLGDTVTGWVAMCPRAWVSMAVLSAGVGGRLVWLLAALSLGTLDGCLWRWIWSVWRPCQVIWSESIYPLVCCSQEEVWLSPLKPMLFSFSTCLALYLCNDIPRTRSFLSDVVSSFHFFLEHSVHMCKAVLVLLSFSSFSC